MADYLKEEELEIFQRPQCLITTGPDGLLEVRPGVLSQLEQIERPLVVVAIAGQYRTGKSYLMNRLARQSHGFSLGTTIQSTTKGLWVWASEHPGDRDKCILLMDTEGLGDVEKGNATHDVWVFCLAALLSSTLIYNSVGAITEDALAKLNLVTEMSKHINTRASNDDDEADDADFDRFFPLFLFVLRDFTLNLSANGREMTADEYLEHCLQIRPETEDCSERYNMPRLCIRKYFKTRKCFTFDSPGNRQQLQRLESVDNSQLSEDFEKEVHDFKQYVYTECPVKKLDDGQEVNGRMLACLAGCYVTAIREGAVPCIESAARTLAVTENTRAVHAALNHYQSGMRALALPTPDLQALRDHHFTCLQKALQMFKKTSVLDGEGTFQEGLKDQLGEKLSEYIRKNEDASRQLCDERLEALDEFIATKLREGCYAKSGGFDEYQLDTQIVQEQFESLAGLGVKKYETLQGYVRQCEDNGEQIRVMDSKITYLEKQADAERSKAQQAEREKEIVEREREKERAALSRDAEETTAAARTQDRTAQMLAQVQRNYELIMAQRLHQQHRLLTEGRHRPAKHSTRAICILL